MQPREFFIAGVKFHDLGKVINELQEGDVFELVPEPTNKYDSNAVQLIFNGTMCGFVPKTFSSEISALIETLGEAICCEVIKVDPKAVPWEQCKVKVYSILDDEELPLDDEDDDFGLGEDDEEEDSEDA